MSTLPKMIALSTILSALGCSSGDAETTPSDDDASVVDGTSEASPDETSGETMPSVGCKSDADCAAILPVTSPPDCATATCNAFGKCELKAKDADGDGFAAAKCSASGAAITIGDDCDDGDKSIFPGGSCAAEGWSVDKGDVGKCKIGKWSCTSGSAVCEGSVGPVSRSCASVDDNDCDGKPDNDTADGFCACPKEGNTQTCTNPGGAVGSPCGAGTQTCQKDPLDPKKLVWSACVGPHVVMQAKGSCGTCNYCNDKAACTPPGLKTCSSADGCTTSLCDCSTWTGNKKLSATGACGSCSYCPGSSCSPPEMQTCTSNDSCSKTACDCSDYTGKNVKVATVAAGGCSCTHCPGSSCSTPAPTKCPGGWSFDGSGTCSIWLESSVDIKDGGTGTTSQSPPASGAVVVDSQARMDYVSGGCYCSDSYDAAYVSCSGSGGSWGPLSQLRSGCNSQPTGLTVLSPVLWSYPYLCSFSADKGWTPFAQGTCWKRGVLRIRWQIAATC